jgi:hypothetical protein
MKYISRLLCGAALFAALLPAALAEEAKVVSATSTLSYTFIEIDRDGKPMWLASDVVEIKPGDRISFDEGIMMMNFYSSDLRHTFPSMTFVEAVKVVPEK